MSWQIGFDDNWNRDIGYGVPCLCDHPDCNEKIDRGLSYVCGDDVGGGEYGCGLFFCSTHKSWPDDDENPEWEDEIRKVCLCERCAELKEPFKPKTDIKAWFDWKITDPSWSFWLEGNFDKLYTGT